MIQVSFSELLNGFVFECDGHAGMAPKGHDLVCAAASALCLALHGRLRELQSEGEIRISQYSVSDGYMAVACEYTGGAISWDRAYSAVKTVLSGFEAVEELYPEYIILL